MGKLHDYQSDPVHEDIRGFQLELAKHFPDIKPTSTYQPNAKTKQGKVSKHAHGEATDYELNPKLKDFLWNTPEGISLLNKYNLGLLDESEKQNRKFGNALHIGKDSVLVERAKKRYSELIPETAPEQKLIDLQGNYENITFASVPDVYREEEPQQQQQIAPQEEQQKIEIPQFQTVEFTPIQEQEQPLPEFKGAFDLYMELEQMQRGGKVKPIYVDSPNDPRYRAYQDSLALHKNESFQNLKNKKRFTGTSTLNMSNEAKDFIDSHSIKPLYTGKIPNSDLDKTYYKKPTQPVEVKRETQETINITPKGLAQTNTELTPNLNITPQARIPQYFNVTDRVNQNFGATETNYRWYPDQPLPPSISTQTYDDGTPMNTRTMIPVFQDGGKIDPTLANNILTNIENRKKRGQEIVNKLKELSEKRQPETTVAKDKTATKKVFSERKFDPNAKNKTDEEIAKERELIRNKADANILNQYSSEVLNPDNWTRQNLAEATAGLESKFRVSDEPNFFDDYLNPLNMIGGMASNLGASPLQAQQADSNIPYLTAIGTPLTVGALSGLGAQNTKQFVNNLTNPLAGVKKDLSVYKKYITNQANIYKDLLTNKDTKLRLETPFDSKSKIYNEIETGYKNLNESLQQKLEDLNTEEGFKRLVNQEKEYLKDLWSVSEYIPEDIINKQALDNAKSRISELEYIQAFGNKNKNFIYEVKPSDVDNIGILKPHISVAQSKYGVPGYNAYYSPPKQPELFDIIGKQELPGELALGRSFTEKPVAYHEINHALQRDRVLNIDNELRKITPNYKKDLSFDQINDYNYFKKGSGGLEPSSFLAELRAKMQEDGFIKNTYDEVTPELIEKAKRFYDKDKRHKIIPGRYGFSRVTDTRLLDFMRPTSDNYKIISDAMNKLPVVIPAIMATQLESKQQGGVIQNNLGQWLFPGEVTQINSPNITMEGVPYPVLGIADTGEEKMMMPNQEYYFEGANSVTEYPQLTPLQQKILKIKNKLQ